MQTSNPGGGSVAIHCDGFHALIIDSVVPQYWKSFEFLQKFDAIIVLQWTTTTNSLLVDLLSSLTGEHLNTKRNTTPLHLKCLITPRLPVQPSRCGLGIASSPKKQSGQPSCFTMALHLGISVMQLSPARASNSRYLQCLSHKELSQTDKETRGNLMHPNMSHPDANTTRLKETVLFHKFGIGTLNMIPIFLRQEAESAHSMASFNALLVWLPAKRLTCDGIGFRSLPARYFLVCSSYNSPVRTEATWPPTMSSRPNSCTNGAHRTTKNEAIDRHAIKQLRFFISQLTTKLVQPSFTPSWRSKLGDSGKNLRTGLSESITFASGFKWSNTLQNEQYGSKQTEAYDTRRGNRTAMKQESLMNSNGGICFETRENAHIVQVGTKHTVNRELREKISDAPYAELYSKNMPVEPFHTICHEAAIPVSKSSEIKKNSIPAPNPTVNGQPSTLNGLNGNKTHGCSRKLAENVPSQISGNSGMAKSYSCPNSFASDKFNLDSMISTSPQRPESIWSDMGSSVFSATVLLSIPEVGEADYYADSPQCLTVADLREMGLYDDSDESDEDVRDEGDKSHDRVSQEVLELTPVDRLR